MVHISEALAVVAPLTHLHDNYYVHVHYHQSQPATRNWISTATLVQETLHVNKNFRSIHSFLLLSRSRILCFSVMPCTYRTSYQSSVYPVVHRGACWLTLWTSRENIRGCSEIGMAVPQTTEIGWQYGSIHDRAYKEYTVNPFLHLVYAWHPSVCSCGILRRVVRTASCSQKHAGMMLPVYCMPCLACTIPISISCFLYFVCSFFLHRSTIKRNRPFV